MHRDPSSYTEAELIRIGRQVVERLARSEARLEAARSGQTRQEIHAARVAAAPDAQHVSIAVPAYCPGCGLWVTKTPDREGIVIDFEREGLALGN